MRTVKPSCRCSGNVRSTHFQTPPDGRQGGIDLVKAGVVLHVQYAINLEQSPA